MSYFRTVLETREAREAIGEGLITLVDTGNLDKGITAMIARGNKNGSFPAAILALILDALGFSNNENI